MNPRTIAAQWDSYDREVLRPAFVGAVQRTETRRAFYAGCRALLSLMMDVSPDDVSEDEGAAMLQKLHDELAAFNAAVKAGKA